jgi:hypothetical protein
VLSTLLSFKRPELAKENKIHRNLQLCIGIIVVFLFCFFAKHNHDEARGFQIRNHTKSRATYLIALTYLSQTNVKFHQNWERETENSECLEFRFFFFFFDERTRQEFRFSVSFPLKQIVLYWGYSVTVILTN